LVIVTTAWSDLGLRMEETASRYGGDCECSEKAVADSRQPVILHIWCWVRG